MAPGPRGPENPLTFRTLYEGPLVDVSAYCPFPFVTGPCDAGVFWRHQELVRRLEAAPFGASRLRERVTLGDVAHAVHASPFHLARLFRQRTGVPVHRYLVRLRLRAALAHLAEGASDLSALALELGFSSHSHFADAFRREFGRAPSAVRRRARREALDEMSKILEA